MIKFSINTNNATKVFIILVFIIINCFFQMFINNNVVKYSIYFSELCAIIFLFAIIYAKTHEEPKNEDNKNIEKRPSSETVENLIKGDNYFFPHHIASSSDFSIENIIAFQLGTMNDDEYSNYYEQKHKNERKLEDENSDFTVMGVASNNITEKEM